MNIPALEALGGRHLEKEGTGAVLDMNASLACDSFLESSIGQQSSSSKLKKAVANSRSSSSSLIQTSAVKRNDLTERRK